MAGRSAAIQPDERFQGAGSLRRAAWGASRAAGGAQRATMRRQRERAGWAKSARGMWDGSLQYGGSWQKLREEQRKREAAAEWRCTLKRQRTPAPGCKGTAAAAAAYEAEDPHSATEFGALELSTPATMTAEQSCSRRQHDHQSAYFLSAGRPRCPLVARRLNNTTIITTTTTTTTTTIVMPALSAISTVIA